MPHRPVTVLCETFAAVVCFAAAVRRLERPKWWGKAPGAVARRVSVCGKASGVSDTFVCAGGRERRSDCVRVLRGQARSKRPKARRVLFLFVCVCVSVNAGMATTPTLERLDTAQESVALQRRADAAAEWCEPQGACVAHDLLKWERTACAGSARC